MPAPPPTVEDPARGGDRGEAPGAGPVPPVAHIIDDDPAVSIALIAILKSAGVETRSYPSAVAFLELTDAPGPGCIITDLQMPQINGIQLIERLAERGERRPIIVISGSGDISTAVLAMKAGARDFIEKPLRRAALLAVVESAFEVDALGRAPGVPPPPIDDLISMLTPREQLVLRGVVAGQGNKLIAREMGISPRTVEIHRAHVMSKTGAQSLSELVRRAVAAGI
jgi:two-component system response regulator FixJ